MEGTQQRRRGRGGGRTEVPEGFVSLRLSLCGGTGGAKEREDPRRGS